MISTKGYFYFDHFNPENKLLKRKKKVGLVENSLLYRKASVTFEQPQQISCIFGKSFIKKANPNNDKNTYPAEKSKNGFKLTFEKLQNILNNSAIDYHPKNNENNPENEQIVKSRIKNSFSELRYRQTGYNKTPKNKQLKEYLFSSKKQGQIRTKSTMVKSHNQKNEVSQSEKVEEVTKKQAVRISPSMSGVFIPSSKFKQSNTKSRNIKRYNTSYNY